MQIELIITMRSESEGARYSKMSDLVDLPYQSDEAEGECTMLSISPVEFVSWRFCLFMLANVFLFVPLLLAYWDDTWKKKFYMRPSTLEDATHFFIINYDQQASLVPKQYRKISLDENQRQSFTCFVNRYLTYYVDREQVVRLCLYDYIQRIKDIGKKQRTQMGLSQGQVENLNQTYGPGTMLIKQPTWFQLFVFELVRPLYIVLIFSVVFWITLQPYYYFASALFTIFAIGVVINLRQLKALNDKIFKMAYHQVKVNVLRQGNVEAISSVDVVPGDIVFFKDPIKIPFEGIILQGSALINECALTGESVPVVKKSDSLQKISTNPYDIDKTALVFEGTTIIQVSDQKKMVKFEQYRQQFGVPVCVVRTNFTTTKGQLVRMILFPREQENKFQRQSYKFLVILFLIAVISYGALLTVNWEYQNLYDIIVKLIDLILIAVPPALPVSMTFGIIYAVDRLQKRGIFCIAQDKVVIGGGIQFSCFDKTGTLTQDHMEFYCVVPAYFARFHTQLTNLAEMADYMIKNIRTKPYYLPILANMATNHSIIKLEESGELVGDPMEIKAFQFGRYRLDQAPEDPKAIFEFGSEHGHMGGVYRRFQFESELQRMSVIAKTSHTEGWNVYAKGSPEMMLTIMKSSSVPKNYNELLKEYASHGFRVLALASKGLRMESPLQCSRAQAEKDLVFNGFEVFDNPLKAETTAAIHELKQARIDCVMITGDNTLTASNISYKCGISSAEKGMLIVDCDAKGDLVDQRFIFHDYDDTKSFSANKPIAESYLEEDYRMSLMTRSNPSKLKHSELKHEVSESEGLDMIKKDNLKQFMFNITVRAEENDCQLCVTGRAFSLLFGGSVSQITYIHQRFMDRVTVFARTKPNDKARIVMVYQQMGRKVSMCGDGANDCGALKQADIGLSLSQAEASISAPFTSQVTNISSMVELIKECRAGLATNFSIFNVIAMYSLIQYSTSIICQIFLQYPADLQFLYWDVALDFLLVFFLGYTGTASKLSIDKPRNSLFSCTNIFQVIVMFVIQFVAQLAIIFLYKQLQPDYYQQFGGMDNARDKYQQLDELATSGVQSNALFLFSNNLYLFSVIAFNISAPWRKQFFTNAPLMAIILLTFAYNALICLVPILRIPSFELQYLPSFKLQLWLYGLSLAVGLLLYLNQKFILEPISARIIRKHPQTKWL